MSHFKDALRARLLADAAVAALVGRRIRWGVVPPKDVLPYVRLQVISDPRPEDLEDYTDARVTRIQCDCFATTDDAVTAVADAIIAAVDAPATVGGIAFGRTKAEGPRDLGEDSEEGFIHRASLDLLAEHSRA